MTIFCIQLPWWIFDLGSNYSLIIINTYIALQQHHQQQQQQQQQQWCCSVPRRSDTWRIDMNCSHCFRVRQLRVVVTVCVACHRKAKLCRISAICFLAVYRKRRLNQVCLLLGFVCAYWFVCRQGYYTQFFCFLHFLIVSTIVREYVFFTFFLKSKKRDFLRFFEAAFQKKR